MRWPLRGAGVIALSAVVLLGLGGPACAHSATGTMGIEATPGPQPLTARVRVLLEYASDRDVAPGATVVATATGPDGLSVAPTPLADEGLGVYAATLGLTAPGTWTVTVTATEPTASATTTVVVSAAPTSTTTRANPASGSEGTRPDDAAQPDSASDDSDGPGPVLAVIAVVVVLGVVAVLAFRRTRRR